MQHLSAELLAVLLQHVNEPLDLVRCSAVCKDWATGVAQLRPTGLTFDHWRHTEQVQEGDISWLQAWQAGGRLQSLQDVSWFEDNPGNWDSVGLKSVFSHAIISYAGLWNLQTCYLEGGFCLHEAACLLPTSLKQLTLRPNVAPVVLRLSKFQRFRDLQQLSVGPFCPYWTATVNAWSNKHAAMSFSVGDCLMANLKCLDLAPRANIAYILDADSNISECLPNLTKLDVRTPMNSFELACRIMALPHLQVLHLLTSERFDEKNKIAVRGKAQLVVSTA